MGPARAPRSPTWSRRSFPPRNTPGIAPRPWMAVWGDAGSVGRGGNDRLPATKSVRTKRGHQILPNLFDPRVYARGLPHEEFRQLRDSAPVSWQEEHAVLDWPAGPGFWAVTRYADV